MKGRRKEQMGKFGGKNSKIVHLTLAEVPRATQSDTTEATYAGGQT